MSGALPRRFGRNTLTSYVNTSTSLVVALVMTPVLVDGLGRTGYGIWALAGSLVLYLELLEFGFGTATVKRVAEESATDDHERVGSAIATSFWLLTVPGVIALLAGAGLAAAFPLLFDVPSALETTSQLLVLVVAVDLAISIPSDTFGAALMGLQRYDLLNATLIAVLIAQAISWAVVLAAGGGLLALGIATAALSLLGQVSRYLIARRLVPGLSLSPRRVDRAGFRPLAGLSVWYWVEALADVLISRIDTIVVGLVVGLPEAAVYAVAQKLALFAPRLIAPATRALFPYSSELAARGDTAAVRRTVVTGTRVSLAIAGPLCLPLALFARPALEAWVGPEFAEGSLVVVYLVAAAAIGAFARSAVSTALGTGLVRVPALVMVGEAALNLVLSVVLGLLLGLAGVALGTLIAAAVSQLGILVPYIGRKLSLSLSALWVSTLRTHVPAAFVALLVAWPVVRAEPSSLAAVAAAGAAVAGAYLAVFTITGLEPRERHGLVSFALRRSEKTAG